MAMDTSGACCVWVCERVRMYMCAKPSDHPYWQPAPNQPAAPEAVEGRGFESAPAICVPGGGFVVMTSYDGHPDTYHHVPSIFWELLGTIGLSWEDSKIGLWMQHDLTIIRSHPLLDWPQKSWAQKDYLEAVVALYQISVLRVPWYPWNHPWLIWKGPSIPAVKSTL